MQALATILERLDYIPQPSSCSMPSKSAIFLHPTTPMKLTQHQGPQRRSQFLCTICGHVAEKRSLLWLHRREHTGGAIFNCQQCDFVTPFKSELSSHMIKHATEKPHACEHCEFRTADPYYARAHARIHSGERPYACTLCDFASAFSSSLRSHVASKHKGDTALRSTLSNAKASVMMMQSPSSSSEPASSPHSVQVALPTTSAPSPLAASTMLTCWSCGYRATDPASLSVHIASHTASTIMPPQPTWTLPTANPMVPSFTPPFDMAAMNSFQFPGLFLSPSWPQQQMMMQPQQQLPSSAMFAPQQMQPAPETSAYQMPFMMTPPLPSVPAPTPQQVSALNTDVQLLLSLASFAATCK